MKWNRWRPETGTATLFQGEIIIRKLDKLMATVDERFKGVIDTLTTIGTNLSDASGKLTEGQKEILAELGKLREGGLTPDQDALLTDIENRVKATSDVSSAIDTAAKAIADISPPVE